MKRINARKIAFGLVAIGLLLGTAALFSAYAENSDSGPFTCAAPHGARLHLEQLPHS